MRALPKCILVSFCAASLAAGCNDRNLRPLTPCTTSGASGNVPINDITNVDLVFMVDDSNSMREEQAKLRAEFPSMVRALITGDLGVADTDGNIIPGSSPDGVADGPAVGSLRVAVVTSDMGVRGVGAVVGDASRAVPSCGTRLDGTVDFTRANYGDDGIFRTLGTTLRADPNNPNSPITVDCGDIDQQDPSPGLEDTLTADALPAYLTFNNLGGGTPDTAELDEYVRHVSCIANVGTGGCTFEQQLESVLKAITPAAESASLLGGPFYADPGGPQHANGHGDDPSTNDGGPTGWFRDDSLFGIVMITDEDDCSAKDATVFDYKIPSGPYYDAFPYDQSQTRCMRFESEFVHTTDRFVDGFMRRRQGREGLLVFAAITGVPEDLTDGPTEGTDNIPAILADQRMQNNYEPRNGAPMGQVAPACQHFDPAFTITATADVTAGSPTLTVTTGGFTGGPTDPTPPTASVNMSSTTNPSRLTNVMLLDNEYPYPGMLITGPNIPPGTYIRTVNLGQSNPANNRIELSAPVTATATGQTVTFGASRGPAEPTASSTSTVTGAGIPDRTELVGLSGSNGTYTLTLDTNATATATGVPITIAVPDVSAAPGRRIAQVANGIREAGGNAVLQSICVDTFRPAMSRILQIIQNNLAGGCLPRTLIRNAFQQVACDVFVTLPQGKSCSDTEFQGAYLVDPSDLSSAVLERQTVTVVNDPNDPNDDVQLERCRMNQVPIDVASSYYGSGGLPNGSGWFYDDYTDERAVCRASLRISFTDGAKPPEGSTLSFGCSQPVQDGDLAVDIYSPCSGSVVTPVLCEFPGYSGGDTTAADQFILRYNLGTRNFDPATDFVCDAQTNTCQIKCANDAECPGGFVCYDNTPAAGDEYCVNPICGTGN